MKKIKYNWVLTEEETPFDIEHLKDLFEDLTQSSDNKVDFTDTDVLDEIDDSYKLSEDEIKKLPELYTKWYLGNNYFLCKKEIYEILDTLCKQYPNEDIESIINDYFYDK